MITNSSMTLYHKILDQETRLYKWIKYNISKVWWFGGKGSNTQKGYEIANDVQVRIPYDVNNNINIEQFSIGDIICKGTINKDIESQDDLEGLEYYNITSINNNNFGNNQHIHLGGK